MIKSAIKKILRAFDYDIIKGRTYFYDFYPDTTDLEQKIINDAREFTITSVRRLESLVRTVKYIKDNAVPGAIVECGVWKGGSIITAANMCYALGEMTREFYLFDTFAGMTEPSVHDEQYVHDEYNKKKTDDGFSTWCRVSQQDVRSNIQKACKLPIEKFHFVEGPVEKTLDAPENIPDQIAVLRLDTDWYESTMKEMEVLFPRVVKNGVVIIDDYGHLQGARKAVDEYLKRMGITPLIYSVDMSCRSFVKTH